MMSSSCSSADSGDEFPSEESLVDAPSCNRLPIRSKWKLSTLDGPTTIESKRLFANPEAGNYFQN